jgi:hypothetical protein
MKKVAILQSNYIPWKGYFDIIRKVDLFIFHDDLQYTKNDWRNRNLIKSQIGKQWISIPCGTSEHRLICEVKLEDTKWQKEHWNKIKNSYSKADHFNDYKSFFEEIYLSRQWGNLSELNQHLIKQISSEILGIHTQFDDSRNYNLQFSNAKRVLELLNKANAKNYLSGPSAKNYLNPSDFEKSGIRLEWMDYQGYPEYNQLYPPFDHNVSIIDLIFNVGNKAADYIKSNQQQ